MATAFTPIMYDAVGAMMPLTTKEQCGGGDAARYDRCISLILLLGVAFSPYVERAAVHLRRSAQIVGVRAQHEEKFIRP